eukprot:5303474-Amphidinium_carterae.1
MVARNPCYLLGDIRLLQAVDCRHWDPQIRKVVEDLEQEGIVDCIVFPTTGTRPLPDMMAGGDLDGDEFTVIWDHRITERLCTQPPYAYPAYEANSTRTRELSNMLELSAIYLAKQRACGGLTGRLDTLYRWWADRQGPCSR